MSRRSALESVGPYFDDSHDFLYWDVELYMRMALRSETGFLAVGRGSATALPRASPAKSLRRRALGPLPRIPRVWFRRALPGFELPREFDQLRSDAFILAALDALEQATGVAGAAPSRRRGARIPADRS